MDNITIHRIGSFHPDFREKLMEDYKYVNNKILGKGVRLRFASVHRDWQEQEDLYNKVPKVTNARGGQSLHNYGLAFDIVLLYDKDGNGTFESASWDTVIDRDGDGMADWMEVADYFKSKGYEWGGDWTSFKDYPHFQIPGYNWRELKYKRDQHDIIADADNGLIYVNLD